MRALLAEQLERVGYDVVLAEDGLHLITRLDWTPKSPMDLPFDAIVSDVRMPGATGLRILQWLRSRGFQIPVVLISAFGTRALDAEAERLGATLINKPFEIETLANVLRWLIERQSECDLAEAEPERRRGGGSHSECGTSRTIPAAHDESPANPPSKTFPGAPNPSSSGPDVERPGQSPKPMRT